jgi:ABC-type bacteriocin/lantibiotic exporter with double-glycine peptidase domain
VNRCFGEGLMMYAIDPGFLWVVLSPLPFAALVQNYVIKFMRENIEKQRKLSEQAAASTNEIIKEVRTVREFAMEQSSADRYCANAAHRSSIELYGTSMNNCVFMPIFFFIVYIVPRFITLYMAGFRVQAGKFSIGQAMAILHGASDMTYHLQRLMNLAPKFPQALIPARRICELLHMKVQYTIHYTLCILTTHYTNELLHMKVLYAVHTHYTLH